MDHVLPLFLLMILLSVALRLIAGSSDGSRIRSYVESRGGRLLSSTWAPFGRGWFGDKDRIYDVRYVDSDGNEHRATCKTSLFSGVYFTDDEIVHHAAPLERPGENRLADLERENRRLREEMERLKGRNF